MRNTKISKTLLESIANKTDEFNSLNVTDLAYDLFLSEFGTLNFFHNDIRGHCSSIILATKDTEAAIKLINNNRLKNMAEPFLDKFYKYFITFSTNYNKKYFEKLKKDTIHFYIHNNYDLKFRKERLSIEEIKTALESRNNGIELFPQINYYIDKFKIEYRE